MVVNAKYCEIEDMRKEGEMAIHVYVCVKARERAGEGDRESL